MTTQPPTVDVYLNPESCGWHLLPVQLSLYLKQTQKRLSGIVSDPALQPEVRLKRPMDSLRKLFFHNTYFTVHRALKVQID